MNIPVIIGALILVGVTIGYLMYPLIRASTLGRRYITDSVAGDRLATLIARRDAIYEAIRDVDFDLETGKVTPEDHRLMRQRLMAEGVRVLQALDRLMQADMRENLEAEIEQAVAAIRESRRQPVPAGTETTLEEKVAAEPAASTGPAPERADGQGRVCPTCGGAVRSDAKFCTHCGASLLLTCAACGASIVAGDQFCGNCGARLLPSGELEDAG